MLEIQNVSVRFGEGRSSVDALDGVSFQCRPGEITGLLGSNGAGKTTLMRVIAGLLAPSSGQAVARVAGEDVSFDRLRTRVGFVSPGGALFDGLTPGEVFRYVGKLRGLSLPTIEARVSDLAGRLGITSLLYRRGDDFSTGQHRKVALLAALLHDPDILLFDEPTSGLDIPTTREVREMMRHCASAGKTVVLASHSADEVALLCSDTVVLHRGRVRASGSPAALAQGGNFEEVMARLCSEETEAVS